MKIYWIAVICSMMSSLVTWGVTVGYRNSIPAYGVMEDGRPVGDGRFCDYYINVGTWRGHNRYIIVTDTCCKYFYGDTLKIE